MGGKYKKETSLQSYRDVKITCYHSASHIPHGICLVDFAAKEEQKNAPVNRDVTLRGTTLL